MLFGPTHFSCHVTIVLTFMLLPSAFANRAAEKKVERASALVAVNNFMA